MRKEERKKLKIEKDCPSSGHETTDPQNTSSVVPHLRLFPDKSLKNGENSKVSEPEKTAQKAQSDSTLKREEIIATKLKNQHLSLKEIAKILHYSHSYARHVWAKYQKEIAQNRGSPSPPFSVHGFWKENIVPVSWLKDCPLDLSKNVNGQRIWKGNKTTMIFHKNGKVMVYGYYDGWEQEAREFLCSFWDGNMIDCFFDSLEDRGKPTVALDTPKVPRNFKVRIRGIGTLKTETTPYPDGTTEFEYDPELLKDMADIKSLLKQLVSCIGKMQQVTFKALENDAQIIKQNTEAIQSFNQFMKDLSAPRKPPEHDRSVV